MSYAGLSVATATSTTLGLEVIREFLVVTDAFSADYGTAMGSVVSARVCSWRSRLAHKQP
jgi:hypothetical protein